MDGLVTILGYAWRGRRRTTVLDLPSDVLVVILVDVYLASGNAQSRSRPITKGDTDGEDVFSMYPTPEYLASVHSTWRRAMSSASVFWTHLVVWIGADPTPLLRVREYLAWSCNRPLNIYVLRRSRSSGEDIDEGNRVGRVVQLILPHIGRWRSLRMETLYSKSLPIPRIDLVGCAPHLTELALSSTVDDDLLVDTVLPLTGDFETPKLELLAMHGCVFRHAYVQPFPRLQPPPKLITLSLSHHHQPHRPLTVVDLLLCLARCTRLRAVDFRDLELDCIGDIDPIPRDIAAPLSLGVDCYGFTDMSGAVIAECSRLLSELQPEYFTLKRCTDPVPYGARLPLASALSIEEVQDSAVLLSLLVALPGTPHDKTELVACDGLTSSVLRDIAKPAVFDSGFLRQGTERREAWPLMYTSSLTITKCTQFRSSDVRALLRARLMAQAASGNAGLMHQDFAVASIQYLCVTDCCELDLEDKEWLDHHVEVVQWDDWKGGRHFRRREAA